MGHGERKNQGARPSSPPTARLYGRVGKSEVAGGSLLPRTGVTPTSHSGRPGRRRRRFLLKFDYEHSDETHRRVWRRRYRGAHGRQADDPVPKVQERCARHRAVLPALPCHAALRVPVVFTRTATGRQVRKVWNRFPEVHWRRGRSKTGGSRRDS